VTTFHNAYDDQGAVEALVQFGDGARRAGHRDLGFCRRARRETNTASAPTGCARSRAASTSSCSTPSRVNGDRVADLAAKWRVPDGFAVVMLPGRLTRWKGGLDFIEAIARLGRRDLCCLLVGAEQRAGFRRELERRSSITG
jgi:glycosyltransferase involved in cell wall biosynthesis